MINDIEPKQLHTLNESQQVKAYAHPTRMLILEMLARERRTISSVAKDLQVHPANITHHFKLLEKADLIQLVEKKDTGRNLEKYYRAIAYHFTVQMDSSSELEKKATALSIARDELTVAIENLRNHIDLPLLTLIKSARVRSDQLDDFFDAMEKLLKDFECSDSPDGVAFSMNLNLYPAAYLPTKERKEIVIK